MGQSEECVLRWSPEAGGSLFLSANAVAAPVAAAAWRR